MNEIVAYYGDLISFLASLLAIVGAFICLVLYWWTKRSKTEEDNHKYIVEKRFFEINNLESIRVLGWHTDKDTVSIHTLMSIYNDPSKSKELKNKYAGTYDQLYKVISLHREKTNGKLQATVIGWFCVFVFITALLATYF